MASIIQDSSLRQTAWLENGQAVQTASEGVLAIEGGLKAVQLETEDTARVKAIFSAMNTILPISECRIIDDYLINSPEKKVRRYFLDRCYAYQVWYRNGTTWDKARASFEAFIKNEAIDLAQVDCIDLSGLNCAAYVRVGNIWSSGHRIMTTGETDLSSLSIDQALTFVFQMLPQLREVVAHNTPGFLNSFASIEFAYDQGEVSSLEKIDLSHNKDIHEYAFFKFLLRAQDSYPKLKTVILTGCNISQVLKKNAKEHCPNIEFIYETIPSK